MCGHCIECSPGKCRRFVEIWFTFPHKAESPSGRTVTDKRDNNVIMDNGKWKTGETGKQETEKPETGQMDWTYLQRLTILQMAPVAGGSRDEEYDTDRADHAS